MANFDPERDGWSLCEAVRRTANEWAMAALHRDLIDAAAAGIAHEPIHWWHWADPPPPPPAPVYNPPRPVPFIEHNGRRWLLDYGIETQFLHKLYAGRIACWGRLGSVLSDYRRVPSGAVTGIESWWKGGGIIRIESGELLYTVRVERPEKAKTNSGGSPGISYRGTVIAQTVAWLDAEGDQPLSEVIKFIQDRGIEIDTDGGPSRNTLKAWAEKAKAEFYQMRETD